MGVVVRDVNFGGPRPKPLPAAEPIRIDDVARERAEGVISEIAMKAGEIEAYLAWLGGFVPERSLASSAVGSMGLSAGEIREQVPVLRQAIRDMSTEGAA